MLHTLDYASMNLLDLKLKLNERKKKDISIDTSMRYFYLP